MAGNKIIKNTEVTTTPTEVVHDAFPTDCQESKLYNTLASESFKAVGVFIKEGLAQEKADRTTRSKCIDIFRESNANAMETTQEEYHRVVKKLNGQLDSQERDYYEKRASGLADRMYSMDREAVKFSEENMPPRRKGISKWIWIGLISIAGAGGFCFGHSIRNRC